MSKPVTTRTEGPWMRTITTHTKNADGFEMSMSHTEYLDEEAAVKRLHEAMRERGDAGLMTWLDIALNGWGDDEGRAAA